MYNQRDGSTVDPGAAQRRAWAENVLPPVEQVRPGLWSIPDSPLRYVLVYAFEHADDFSIVAAGWNTDAAWRSLSTGSPWPAPRSRRSRPCS